MLYMKNVNRVQKKLFLISAKDRMIHFNVSVTLKCGRDNKGCDDRNQRRRNHDASKFLRRK